MISSGPGSSSGSPAPDMQSAPLPLRSLFIHHEANAASGGHVNHEVLAAFLSRGEGPEQQELLRLIRALVEEHSTHP
jgi:hypothetical protein